MKHNKCGDGSQPIMDFMVGVFQFHIPDPVTFGNVLSS